MVTGLQPAGFPHSDMHGSLPVCGSPCLFAAYHVLRRFRKPRHPPFALVLFLVNHLRLHSLKCILPMKLQSLFRNSKKLEFLNIRLNLFLFFTSLCLSILSMNCAVFSNGLQRYALFRNLQIYFSIFLQIISFSALLQNFQQHLLHYFVTDTVWMHRVPPVCTASPLYAGTIASSSVFIAL